MSLPLSCKPLEDYGTPRESRKMHRLWRPLLVAATIGRLIPCILGSAVHERQLQLQDRQSAERKRSLADFMPPLPPNSPLPPNPPAPPSIPNQGVGCWALCGKAEGPCSTFCGESGSCCREGYGMTIFECGFGALGFDSKS